MAIVTGGGRGIGREYALLLAECGARVVVNDLGGAMDGSGVDEGPADAVAAEIRARGGDAVANTADVADWDGARRMVYQALSAFGQLDVLVNNAGILRDRMLFNMSIEDWDAVIRVHLRGTFAPSRIAAAYWREQAKAGNGRDARLINTTSASGLYGQPGQANYAAAKAGAAGFTIVAAKDLAPYGVTVNAIAPGAVTRMTEGLVKGGRSSLEGSTSDWTPDHIAPLVGWLASPESKDVTGRVFNVRGNEISIAEGWRAGPAATASGDRWTLDELDETVPALLEGAAPMSDIRGRPLQADPARAQWT